MPDPEQLDPAQPEPAADATLRLPTGLPMDPRSTVQVDISKLLDSHSKPKPLAPEPALDATQRLPVGIPLDPQGTVKLKIPKDLDVHIAPKAPPSAPVKNPSPALKVALPKGNEPPLRIRKVDTPQEVEGQTEKVPTPPVAAKPFSWKLPIGMVGLGILGVVGYVALSRKLPPRPAARSAGKVTMPTPSESSLPPAARLLLEQARAGNTHAMRMLGVMYCNGLDVPLDREKGLYWYRQAAAKGSDAARAELAQIEGGR